MTAEPVAAPGVKSLEKGLELLALFRGAGCALRVTEVAASIGVPVSTAHRLLRTLIAHGYVRQNMVTRFYLAGPALLDLAQELVEPGDLARVARPELRDLVARTRETAAICVLHGTEAHFTLCLNGTEVLRVVPLPAHLVVPAHATSGGKVLLAQLPTAELRGFFKRSRLFVYRARTIATRGALERELAQVRSTGYAVSREEAHEGVCSLAVGIRGGDGSVIAALSLLCPAQRMPQTRVAVLVTELRRSAGRIATRFAHAPASVGG